MKIQECYLANDKSTGASFNSIGVKEDEVFTGSIQIVSTGGSGTYQVEVSNDLVPLAPVVIGGNQDPAANVVNWIDYTGKSATFAGASKVIILLDNIGFKWVRVSYTRTAGTGLVKIIFFAKG